MIRFLAFLFYLLIQLIGKTLRLNPGWKEEFERAKEGKNAIFAVWHQASFALLYLYGSSHAVLLVTAEKRGKILGECAKRLGFQTVPIPTPKENFESVAGLASLLELIKEGKDVVIAVDGPGGPLFEIKPGVFYLSEKAKIPIIPVAVKAPFKITLFWRWDKYFIPLPFSRVGVRIGKAIWPHQGGAGNLARKLTQLSR